jgi:rubrerythrin
MDDQKNIESAVEPKNIESAANTEPFIPDADARAAVMELVWRCNNCGNLFPVGTPIPETCPNCGKGKEYFEHVTED